jgi:ABC-type antimicrobial peptide transport system permease subunit
VDALRKAGILEQWRDGRRVYLKPDTHSPVFLDLKGLFDTTAGLIPVLQQSTNSSLRAINSTGPLTYLTVRALLFGIAAIAAYIPACRATRFDPRVALRYV